MEKLLQDKIRKRILAEVTPTKRELDLQKTVINSLKQALYDHRGSREYSFSFIEEQGSTGRKQTQLKGAADIDLFVGLKPDAYSSILEQDQNKRNRQLDRLMNKMVKEWFEPAISGLNTTNVQRAFSQHPYLSLRMLNLEIDILGCFDIDSKYLAEKGPITAVDRTVHHTRFIADQLTEEKRDDARILKSFVRASHAYGDRCAVGRMGITGVALELLAIFSNTLEDALSALEQLVNKPIDPKKRPLNKLRKISTFKDDYIILIDPTDHQRNIASSFTPRAYDWVKHRIGVLREVVKKGTHNEVYNLFIESPIPGNELPIWLKKHSLAREFISDESKHYTILRDKLYRLSKKVQAALRNERTGQPRFGESLLEVYFEDNRYSLGMFVEKPSISKYYVRKGPPTNLVDAAEEFRKSHVHVEEKDGHLWTIEERQWLDPQSLVDKILEDNPIQGLARTTKTSDVSYKVLNILYRYVLPIETHFLEKITKVKDAKSEDS